MPAEFPSMQSSDLPLPAVPDCWIFDLDGCLIDSLTGTSLRPGARVVLEHLQGQSRRTYLWSAGGYAYAQSRAHQFALERLVTGCFGKDGRDTGGFYVTDHLPISRDRSIFIDDRPEDLDEALDVLAVSPYLTHDQHDRGLHEVAKRAGFTNWHQYG